MLNCGFFWDKRINGGYPLSVLDILPFDEGWHLLIDLHF
jgi:hypothetical protein